MTQKLRDRSYICRYGGLLQLQYTNDKLLPHTVSYLAKFVFRFSFTFQNLLTIGQNELQTNRFNIGSFYDYAIRNDLHADEFNKASFYD